MKSTPFQMVVTMTCLWMLVCVSLAYCAPQGSPDLTVSTDPAATPTAAPLTTVDPAATSSTASTTTVYPAAASPTAPTTTVDPTSEADPAQDPDSSETTTEATSSDSMDLVSELTTDADDSNPVTVPTVDEVTSSAN